MEISVGEGARYKFDHRSVERKIGGGIKSGGGNNFHRSFDTAARLTKAGGDNKRWRERGDVSKNVSRFSPVW